jgi:FGGY-family pentulose kinase
MAELVAAVDVGTGSARAGLFAADGRMLGRAEAPIAMREPGPDRAEQDSEDIWAAVGRALHAARAEAGAAPEAVAGLGFDATCSLVLRDRDGRPLGASGDAGEGWDTILWSDHRARAEAAACTATGDPVLATLGGVMSPEMQIPKLMWLARRRPDRWARLGLAMDLGDFLAWKATGRRERSLCTLACKWTYRAAAGWPDGFLRAVGLDDLRARCGLPERVLPLGAALGPLAPAAARTLGLTPRVQVAAGLIDAHAGALGVLGGLDPAARARQAALVAGTSNCLMTLTPFPVAGAGLWGPAFGAVLPELWVTEGGQSAAGALLDQVCRLRGGTPDAATHMRIAARIAELRAAEGWDLAPDLHVLPDFRGNRAPYPDPDARGAISGLGLDASFDGLCRLYWRAAVGLALGLADVLAALRDAGAPIERLQLTGGHARNPLLPGLYATATDLPIETHDAQDAVLLGAAMTAAAAAGLHPDLGAAARAMRPSGRVVAPDPAGRRRLADDHRVLAAMRRDRALLRALAAGAAAPG